MKYLTLLFALIVTIIAAVSYFRPATNDPVPVLGVHTQPESSPADVIHQQVGNPQTIQITSLQVNASIESVGLDAQRKMDVPKKAANVGWYNLGAKPGEIGNAVLAGHLDTVTGKPAVFWNLSNIAIGSEITVSDEHGQQYRYKVIDKKTYPYDNFPLQEIFGPERKALLRLITCEGQFNNTAQTYTQRTVVTAEMIE